MSFELIGPGDPDPLDPSDGWGDVPVADRPLWSRYMVDHLPWFPGVTVMNLVVPGVMNGGTRAPRIWKDAARGLHAQGFTPLQYYLLATLLRQALAAGELDERIHAPLFEQWFDERRSSTSGAVRRRSGSRHRPGSRGSTASRTLSRQGGRSTMCCTATTSRRSAACRSRDVRRD